MNKILSLSKHFKSNFASAQTKLNIGFVGTGNMGGPMAINLSKNGYNVFAFDAMSENLSKLQGTSINLAKNLQEVGSNADVVITMLPNDKIVRDVMNNGIFDSLKKGGLIIDSSTILPNAVQELGEQANKKGLTFVDAPVSGGVTGATNATLTFMLGTQEQQLIDKCTPILQSMGKNIFPCGNLSSGQIAKMCNNMALAIQMQSVAEAHNLGVKCGMDPKLLSKVMSVSSGRCWSVDTYNPVPGVMENVPSSRQYENGFACKLMLKDLGIAKESAQLVNASTPLGENIIQLYETLVKEGYADKDFGVVYEYLLNKK